MTTNHTPVFTTGSQNVSFTETSNTTGSTALHTLTGTLNFTDSDHSDTHTTSAALKSAVWSGGSAVPSTTLAALAAAMSSSITSDHNGSGTVKWTFSDPDKDFDFLAKNETLVITYDITVADNHGGTTKQTVKVTVTGTDDAPVINMETITVVNEQTNHTLSFSPDTAHIALSFSDVDLDNTNFTASVTGVTASGVTAGLLPDGFGTAELLAFYNVDNVSKHAGSSSGTVNTTFSAPDLAFDYLAAGEQLNLTYTVKLDDHAGGISTQTVAVTVVGTNDKPTVLAFPESAHLTEDHNLSGGNLAAHGDFLFSDIDLSDTHTLSTTVTATRSGGGTVPISNADLLDAMGATFNPDSTSQLIGDVSWNFALSNSAVKFLGDGETLTLDYHITVTDPAGASDTEEVCITVLGTNHPIVTKTATVPGGTADTPGEVISYSISVANAGHTTLTGITVSDPSVTNLAPVLSSGFNVGDTNHDNKLSAGETWQYAASHTVTQDDIDTNGGGDGVIENTVTVQSDQALPVTAVASVPVEQHPTLQFVKTANVASVDASGDVINYSLTVKNIGTTTLNGVDVQDSQVNNATPIVDINAPILGTHPFLAQVLNGDYNAGDTNQNGVQDPGETFVYVNAGDTNQNGIQDPGETFLFANIGDTNQNGFEDTGEHFQYYNAGDTNHNGVQDPGETFQFIYDHSAAPVLSGGFNVGDTNHNGFLDIGETWQYTVSYTVTQDDIDNGGVVQPGLTHDNTATVTTASGPGATTTDSVTIVQDPHVTLDKTATVADGTADAAGDVINYAISVTNDGNMTLTSPVVSDPSVSNLTLVSGDTNSNGKIDVGETWHYTASHTVTQNDIDNGGVVNPALSYNNTASVTTAQSVGASDSASVPIVQDPHVTLDKTATVPGGTADTVGEVISYAISVANDGNMSLTGVTVSDPSVSNLAAVMSGSFNAGDTNHDGKLSVGETWQYAASHTVTAGDIAAGGSINNTASVSTNEGATSSDSASVPVANNPAMTLVEAALGYHDTNNNNTPDAGETIDFSFTVNNTGNATLHAVGVSDPDGVVTITGGTIPSLGVGVSDSTTWAGTYVLQSTDIANGYHDFEAVAISNEVSAASGTVHVELDHLILL